MNILENARLIKKEHFNTPTEISQEKIERLICEKINSIELWIENRNSKIYKVKTDSLKNLIIKQNKTMNLNSFKSEYESLINLALIKSNNLSVPKAYGFISEDNLYMMDLVNGESIASLVDKKKTAELLEACRLAGKVISEIHSSWNCKIEYKNSIEEVFEDLKKIPKELTSKERKILDRSFLLIHNKGCPIGKVYKDFDPLNLYFFQGEISLIDPPESAMQNTLFWDLATFNIGLRKAFIKKGLFFNRTSVEECENIFLLEYKKNLNFADLNEKEFNVFLSILELQRIGELMIFQEKHKIKNKFLSKSSVYNIFAFKMLHYERRRVIRKLEKIISVK
ncbi:hypothetical protein [Alkalicoccobacillus porphyridii]|uniref:Phosphotransferase n=1 Tax=Alkalicoccobacillus porphyridii TaxID=2597270 RepID=A0A554A4E5_9BACI|nr:hypothetical protein [Alkalicoccobacillus porphyridii]TSB48570.1 hypothetical protein FN960_03175 [Alkalicoccobacillus porphyridii]